MDILPSPGHTAVVYFDRRTHQAWVCHCKCDMTAVRATKQQVKAWHQLHVEAAAVTAVVPAQPEEQPEPTVITRAARKVRFGFFRP